MMQQRLVFAEDVSKLAVGCSVLVCVLFLLVTLFEVYRKSHRVVAQQSRFSMRPWVLGSAVLAAGTICLAVLRPAVVRAKTTSLGAKVVILIDRARRMTLSVDGQSRAAAADAGYAQLLRHFGGLRVSAFEFGDDQLRPLAQQDRKSGASSLSEHSDVTTALNELARKLDEKPSAIVVLSDGRWLRSENNLPQGGLALPAALSGTVLHAVDVGGRAPRDASVLSVKTVGTAVAHQPLSIAVDVYCSEGLRCDTVPVVVREHKKGVAPVVLARGDASFTEHSSARVSLDVTIERAGTRIIEVAIDSPDGDEVKANDRRLLTVEVVRDRLRLLHVAGRPTYDVRALRTWLKSDASVDLVSFFILRTDSDDTNADEDSELALIPFPVDELFTEHLPSFDAVILEDIDAERYRLAGHFENLARYVEQGGGLLLVGGPSAFSGGAYASSPIERVLPVALVNSEHPFDTVEFVPRVTAAGRAARLLEPLRSVLGSHLPSMPGANSLGPARPHAVVLWEHPGRTALPIKTGGAPGPMPVLAVSEVGDGRVVALGVDGTHRLAWGQDGLETAGRAYGALWDGLLGWVMRDRRFESAQGELLGACIAGLPARARVTYSAQVEGTVTLELQRLDASSVPTHVSTQTPSGQKTVIFELGSLAEGGYSALARSGDGPAARFDFACEGGGSAWADSRPDPKRLQRLAEGNFGRTVSASRVEELPLPEEAEVTSYRQVSPLLPPWVWSLSAAVSMAAHWLLRRRSGLC